MEDQQQESLLLRRLCPRRGTKTKPGTDSGLLVTSMILRGLDGFFGSEEDLGRIVHGACQEIGDERDGFLLVKRCLEICQQLGLVIERSTNMNMILNEPTINMDSLNADLGIERIVKRCLKNSTEKLDTSNRIQLQTSSQRKMYFNSLDTKIEKLQQIKRHLRQVRQTEHELLQKVFGANNVDPFVPPFEMPESNTPSSLIPAHIFNIIDARSSGVKPPEPPVTDLASKPSLRRSLNAKSVRQQILNTYKKMHTEEKSKARARTAMSPKPSHPHQALSINQNLEDPIDHVALPEYTDHEDISKAPPMTRLEEHDPDGAGDRQLDASTVQSHPLAFSEVVCQFRIANDEESGQISRLSLQTSSPRAMQTETNEPTSKPVSTEQVALPSFRVHDWRTDPDTDFQEPDISDEMFLRRHEVALKAAKDEWDAIQKEKDEIRQEERLRRQSLQTPKGRSPRAMTPYTRKKFNESVPAITVPTVELTPASVPSKRSLSKTPLSVVTMTTRGKKAQKTAKHETITPTSTRQSTRLKARVKD